MAIEMPMPPPPPNTPVNTDSGAFTTPFLLDSLSNLQITSARRNTIITGISGPPSSGKTVLASLLAEIFGTAAPNDELKSEMSDVSSSRQVKHGKAPVKKSRVTIVHQKDYLFNDPGFMDLKDFCTTTKDDEYMKRALHGDGPVLFETNGTLPLGAGSGEGSTHSSNLRATALDRDSDASIRFTALHCDLEIIQSGGKPLHLRVAGSGKDRGFFQETNDQGTKSKSIVAEYASLIHEMRNKVQAAFGPIEANTDFCFVEGSFLYRNPAEEVNDYSRLTADQREAHAQKYMDLLNNLTLEIEDDGGIGTDEQWAESDELEKKLAKCNDLAKGMMQPLIQVKLLLPTSKEVAKVRHFAQKPYIDGPAGERMGGELCTTDGYFETLLWKNWVKEHKWLPTDADYYPGICVRPVVDAGVDFTVRWAVDTILQDMGYKVPDPQAKKCCGQGCCERGRSGSSTEW